MLISEDLQQLSPIKFRREMIAVIFVLLFAGAFVSNIECTRVVTFNVGLTPLVKDFDIRRNKVPSALCGLGADIFGIQEMWQEKDIQNVIDKCGHTYRYHFSAIHYDVGKLRCPEKSSQRTTKPCSQPATCSQSDLQYFQETIYPCEVNGGCMQLLNVSAASALLCVVKKCAPQLNNTSFTAECLTCLAMASNGNDLPFATCSDPSNRFNGPGLLILSNREFHCASYASFFPNKRMVLPRGYLRVKDPLIGRFVATHLSATDFPYLEYDLDYGSYSEQQKAEIGVLADKFSKKNVVIAGDFNAGPQVSNTNPEKNLTGEAAENYQELINAGFSDPYLDENGRCTFCSSNQYTATNYSRAIDHILLHGNHLAVNYAKRILDKEPVSDHYGVELEVRKKILSLF